MQSCYGAGSHAWHHDLDPIWILLHRQSGGAWTTRTRLATRGRSLYCRDAAVGQPTNESELVLLKLLSEVTIYTIYASLQPPCRTTKLVFVGTF